MEAPLDIVMPVYNEGGNIRHVIMEIAAKVQCPYSLHLVYDFAQDDTLPEAGKASQELGIPVNFIQNKYGRGVLNAIKTGLEETKGDYVVVTMADLSDPAEVINAMCASARQNNADIVCASRYMRGGKQIRGPLLKKTLSRLAGVSLHYLVRLPTHDVTNSFKLYSRRVLSAITIESRGGFELGMEIVVKAYSLGFKITEVPTTWQDRTAGSSRFHLWQWLPRYWRWYWFALRKYWLEK